jgi:hypothetical protein
MIKGTLKADGLAVLEITNVSFIMGTTMRAKIAFVSDSGATMGWTEHSNWSKETQDKLKVLKESMEKDVAQVYLVGHDDASSPTPGSGPKGLLDHLGGKEPPSV